MLNQYACTEKRFLKDAAQHVMTVIRDDGLHRHLRFRKARPAGSEYWFDLITWPGSLCIDGDMGTYVFRRLEDMFEFFRTDREYLERRGCKLAINPSYWSEKLQAPKPRHADEFSKSQFRSRVLEAFDSWVETSQPDDDEFTTQAERDEFKEKRTALRYALADEVLNCINDGETRAYDAARDFSCSEVPEFNMDDCWEWNCREYTFHFIWCCYAIAWGVKTYDETKTATQETTACVAINQKETTTC